MDVKTRVDRFAPRIDSRVPSQLSSAIRVIAIALLCQRLIAAEFSYKQSSNQAYDAATLIRASEFRDANLSKMFETFVSTKCGTRKLARLILATNERDLGNAVNTILPGSVSDSQIREAQLSTSEVAQVLCFEGRATLFIRKGRIARREVFGNADARKLVLQGVPLTIVGFRLRIGTPNAVVHDGRTRPNRVWIYATTQVLPDAEIAARMREELERRLEMQVYLIVRTDSFFSAFDGPICDLFDSSAQVYSGPEALSRPSVVCSPGSGRHSCELLLH